tara:strand:- start:333 stop:611 length:279 start_codon:yes stop_codon:yes gene_type:complete
MNIELLKEHLRIESGDRGEEATLQLYLDAAIGHVSEYLGDDLPDPMPDPVKSAVLLLTCDLYVNRERQSSEPLYQNKTYTLLLAPYRSMTVL